jgi:cyanate lyase
MNKEEMTDLIITSKKSKGLTWEAIAGKLDMDIDKQEDPKGDRVVITMNGKFLRYSSW